MGEAVQLGHAGVRAVHEPTVQPPLGLVAVGAARYRVSHTSSGESAMVDVAQPLGPDGIWVVTSVTPLATTAAGAT